MSEYPGIYDRTLKYLKISCPKGAPDRTGYSDEMKGRKWNAIDGSIELETNDDLEDGLDDDRLDDVDELAQRIDRRAV